MNIDDRGGLAIEYHIDRIYLGFDSIGILRNRTKWTSLYVLRQNYRKDTTEANHLE